MSLVWRTFSDAVVGLWDDEISMQELMPVAMICVSRSPLARHDYDVLVENGLFRFVSDDEVAQAQWERFNGSLAEAKAYVLAVYKLQDKRLR